MLTIRTQYIVTGMIAIALLGTVAAQPSNIAITGDYLRLSDRHVIHYNTALASLTDVGVGTQSFNCVNRGSEHSPYHTTQCGECDYVPSYPAHSWESEVTQYRYGRCANANVSATSATGRIDVQLVNGPGETGNRYSWSISLRFEDSQGSLIVPPTGSPYTNPLVLDQGSCSYNPVVFCTSDIVRKTNVASVASALSAPRYCMEGKIFKTLEGGLTQLDPAFADPCTEL